MEEIVIGLLGLMPPSEGNGQQVILSLFPLVTIGLIILFSIWSIIKYREYRKKKGEVNGSN